MKNTFNSQHKHAPLSRVVEANGMLYLSGDASIHHETRELVGSDIETQTRYTLENLKRTLESVGSSLDKVVKTTVFLKDVRDFNAMNEIYQEYFPSNRPARSTVGVQLVRDEMLIEIELVALP